MQPVMYAFTVVAVRVEFLQTFVLLRRALGGPELWRSQSLWAVAFMGSTPIGGPLGNVQVHVLDRRNQALHSRPGSIEANRGGAGSEIDPRLLHPCRAAKLPLNSSCTRRARHPTHGNDDLLGGS